MTERLTGVEIQAQLLDEMQRVRKAAEGIRTLLLVEFIIAVIAVIVWIGISGYVSS